MVQINSGDSFTCNLIPPHWIDISGKDFCDSASHVWYYSNDQSSGNIPEGMPCSCGAMIAYYDICPTCGHERFNPKPKEET